MESEGEKELVVTTARWIWREVDKNSVLHVKDGTDEWPIKSSSINKQD